MAVAQPCARRRERDLEANRDVRRTANDSGRSVRRDVDGDEAEAVGVGVRIHVQHLRHANAFPFITSGDDALHLYAGRC